MEFNFFTAENAEQFTFYRIPKILITNNHFKNLSAESKLMYGLLLDRVSLSIKNNWIDNYGHVYIIYTVEELMENLNYGNQKISKLFKELVGIGLIEKKRQGLGKPDLIYVKNFSKQSIQNLENSMKCENHISENVEITSQKVLKSHAIYTDNNKTNINNKKSHVSHVMSDLNTSKDIKMKLKKDKDFDSDPDLKNKTNEMNLENEIKQLELKKEIELLKNKNFELEKELNKKNNKDFDKIKFQEKQKKYLEIIKDNINYKGFNSLIDKNVANEFINIMLMYLTEVKDDEITINKNTYNLEVVKSRLLKLNQEHFEYAYFKFIQVENKINNKNKYILACLFNSFTEVNSNTANSMSEQFGVEEHFKNKED